MRYITQSGLQTVANAADGILVQINASLTGTIAVQDGDTVVATITNPAAGDSFTYKGFTGAPKVNPSATCDITVSILN